jgi:hypothetical protein
MAFTKKYMAIYRMAGKDRGTLTWRKVFHLGMLRLSATLSISRSSFFRVPVAVR